MSENKKVKELSEKLINGVQQTFKSDNFKKYLKFASHFHSYSLRNTILILTQCQNANRIAGYDAWKKLGRYVKRGEKGIAIFAPSKVKVKKDVPIYDEDGNPKISFNGEPITKEDEKTLINFHVTYLYDVSQTDGEPLPEICKELNGSVDDFEKIFNAVKKISPYKIVFEQIDDGAKGYCDYKNKKIVVKMGMSDEQIIKTLIHEFAHSVLHEETEKRKGQREIEAESTAFMVSDFLGIDTSDYSFEYVANWCRNMKTEELQQSLENIQSTANQIINSISEEIKILEKGKNLECDKHQKLQERITQAAEKSNKLKNEKELNPFEKNIHE